MRSRRADTDDATVARVPAVHRNSFRLPGVNAFNHPVFDTVGTAVNTTATGLNPGINNFGVVTGTRDARVARLGLKIYLY